MGSDFVVISPPVFNDFSGMFQVHKPVGMEFSLTLSSVTRITKSQNETVGKVLFNQLSLTPAMPDF
jgi:hypothetical protein